MPSQEWIRNNRVNVTIHTPDRQPGEAPIRPDQMETLKAFSPDFDLSKVSGFGEVQADSLITQLKDQQNEVSKCLLKQFYAQNGHAVSPDFIDHCYDHPGEPWVQVCPWLHPVHLLLLHQATQQNRDLLSRYLSAKPARWLQLLGQKNSDPRL